MLMKNHLEPTDAEKALTLTIETIDASPAVLSSSRDAGKALTLTLTLSHLSRLEPTLALL